MPSSTVPGPRRCASAWATLDVDTAAQVADLPAEAWVPAVSADGADEREHAQVAELTGSVDLSPLAGPDAHDRAP